MYFNLDNIKHFKYRIIFSLLLLLIGILILTIGLIKTLFLTLCTTLGYFVGFVIDKKLFVLFIEKIKEIFYIGRE